MSLFENITTIHSIVAMCWLLSALADYLHFTYIWQLKEYRIDRFRDYLQSEKGKELTRSYRVFFRPIVWLFAYTFLGDDIRLQLLMLGLFITDLGYNIYSFYKHNLRRPECTIKACAIILVALIIEGFTALFFQPLKLLMIFFVGRYFFHAMVVQAFQGATFLIKEIYIYFAKKKLSSFPNLITVGITGSYGKSSVKEFTSHLLSGTYRVVKTPRNTNTEIGIAKFILQHNFTDNDIFVCEMGAYKIGEIQKICSMVSPKVGILTAINEQHLSLFGAIEKTQQAKYELLRSIPQDGLIITNAENRYCTEFLDELACKNQLLFGADDDQSPDLLITNIDAGINKSSYELIGKNGERQSLQTPVIGAHHAYNIAAAYLVAHHFHISDTEIIERAKTLPTHVHGSLEVYQYGNATIIDDSYNSNPKGFVSAIEVMSKFPSERKRVVITRGMLELGEQSEEIHERLGGEIAFVADELVVTTRDSYEWLKKGVGKKYHTNISLKTDAYSILKYIQELKQTNAVILLENKTPGNIKEELSSYKPRIT